MYSAVVEISVLNGTMFIDTKIVLLKLRKKNMVVRRQRLQTESPREKYGIMCIMLKNHVRDSCFSLMPMSDTLKIKLKERFLLIQLVKFFHGTKAGIDLKLVLA